MILMDVSPEAVSAWFTPFHYFVYLGTLFVGMVVYYQWKWSRICKKNIQVLVVQQGGGGEFQLAQKAGGEVSINNPNTNSVRTWPVNELATIDVLYPGVGFIPAFLQKTIRMAIVHEGDWEPLLNRSPHMLKVASPDLVTALEDIAKQSDDSVNKAITKILDGVQTSPTREMIASPAVLGNLMHEKITEAVITVNKEMIDSIAMLTRRLSKLINPMVVYVGLGLVLILLVFSIYQGMQPAVSQQEMIDELNLIKQALGIKG